MSGMLSYLWERTSAALTGQKTLTCVDESRAKRLLAESNAMKSEATKLLHTQAVSDVMSSFLRRLNKSEFLGRLNKSEYSIIADYPSQPHAQVAWKEELFASLSALLPRAERHRKDGLMGPFDEFLKQAESQMSDVLRRSSKACICRREVFRGLGGTGHYALAHLAFSWIKDKVTGRTVFVCAAGLEYWVPSGVADQTIQTWLVRNYIALQLYLDHKCVKVLFEAVGFPYAPISQARELSSDAKQHFVTAPFIVNEDCARTGNEGLREVFNGWEEPVLGWTVFFEIPLPTEPAGGNLERLSNDQTYCGAYLAYVNQETKTTDYIILVKSLDVMQKLMPEHGNMKTEHLRLVEWKLQQLRGENKIQPFGKFLLVLGFAIFNEDGWKIGTKSWANHKADDPECSTDSQPRLTTQQFEVIFQHLTSEGYDLKK